MKISKFITFLEGVLGCFLDRKGCLFTRAGVLKRPFFVFGQLFMWLLDLFDRFLEVYRR